MTEKTEFRGALEEFEKGGGFGNSIIVARYDVMGIPNMTTSRSYEQGGEIIGTMETYYQLNVRNGQVVGVTNKGSAIVSDAKHMGIREAVDIGGKR